MDKLKTYSGKFQNLFLRSWTGKQKISSDVANIINQIDINVIYRTFTEIDHILGHKTSLNTFQVTD